MTTLWTIYERPNPLQYVARLSRIGEPDYHGERLMVSTYLQTIRLAMMQRGLKHMPPDPNDDPMIVELWL